MSDAICILHPVLSSTLLVPHTLPSTPTLSTPAPPGRKRSAKPTAELIPAGCCHKRNHGNGLTEESNFSLLLIREQ